ncbi:MAG: SelL-related redox protein [Saprospiraceae bacterium]
MLYSHSIDKQLLETMITNQGESIYKVSQRQPVLLIFLRHFGCTFCREALADISRQRESIEKAGTKIVFVHMTEDETAERYFHRYELYHPIHVSDPICNFYQSFGLVKGNFTQLFGLKSWLRGFNAGIVDGHGIGSVALGDGFQMPGVFLIDKGEIRNSFVHKEASDRPNYNEMIKCCQVVKAA